MRLRWCSCYYSWDWLRPEIADRRTATKVERPDKMRERLVSVALTFLWKPKKAPVAQEKTATF